MGATAGPAETRHCKGAARWQTSRTDPTKVRSPRRRRPSRPHHRPPTRPPFHPRPSRPLLCHLSARATACEEHATRGARSQPQKKAPRRKHPPRRHPPRQRRRRPRRRKPRRRHRPRKLRLRSPRGSGAGGHQRRSRIGRERGCSAGKVDGRHRDQPRLRSRAGAADRAGAVAAADRRGHRGRCACHPRGAAGPPRLRRRLSQPDLTLTRREGR